MLPLARLVLVATDLIKNARFARLVLPPARLVLLFRCLDIPNGSQENWHAIAVDLIFVLHGSYYHVVLLVARLVLPSARLFVFFEAIFHQFRRLAWQFHS